MLSQKEFDQKINKIAEKLCKMRKNNETITTQTAQELIKKEFKTKKSPTKWLQERIILIKVHDKYNELKKEKQT